MANQREAVKIGGKKTKLRTTTYLDEDLVEIAQALPEINVSKICNDALAVVLRDGPTMNLVKARERLTEHRAKVGALESHIVDLEQVQAEANNREDQEKARLDSLAKIAERRQQDPGKMDERLQARMKVLKLKKEG